MAGDLKFSEDGFKLQKSLAKMLDDGFHTEAVMAMGTLGLSMSGVIGAAAFALALIKFMTSDNDAEMIRALGNLQKQIDEIKSVLSMLDSRIDELVDQVAIESNRQTLRDLLDYLDSFRQLEIELRDRPNDADTAVRVANEAGIVADKFLRNDFEIWRWVDIVEKPHLNPATGQTTMQNALALNRFKNMPTLPVYAAGVLTWLAARERSSKAGQQHRLVDDQARLARHRSATSVRTEFDKYDADAARSSPTTIPEHIKSRIRAYPIASTRHAQNRICQFHFDAGNLMTGRRKTGEPFDLVMAAGNNVLCTLDPHQLGAPAMELEMEEASGVETLNALSEVLGRLAAGGSLREQLIGVFPNTEVFAPAVLYFVDENADLQWYENNSAAARGGSKEWTGPKKVGGGWGGFTTVFNGGGHAIYGIRPDGALLWHGHDGHADGAPAWRGPVEVGSGWQRLRTVFSGGEYVVYGVESNGDLRWYRHDGAPQGGGSVSAWAAPTVVDTGWSNYTRVFSGGGGVIYGIRPDGVLERRIHTGYLTGTSAWEAKKEIGSGWGGFREVIAAANGVLYAFTADGRILWHRYGKRPPLPPTPNATNLRERVLSERPAWGELPTATGGGGVLRPEVIRPNFRGAEISPSFATDVERWEGPVEIKRGVPAFRSVFVRTDLPFRGPR